MEKNITSEDKPETITAAGSTKLKGKYISVVGKRKTATVQIRLYKNGTGVFLINNSEKEYFIPDLLNVVKQPLKLTSHLKDVNISINVSGGGKKNQAEAARHGIAKALLEIDEELRPVLKSKNWLTRDARKKERKKPGLKKARKAPQWAKR